MKGQLIGYKNTHAHYDWKERMRETPEKYNHFLNELLERQNLAAEREYTSWKILLKT